MTIVFEDNCSIDEQKQKTTLIDWSFLDRMKVGQSLLVDRYEFSKQTNWPKWKGGYAHPPSRFYPIALIRQHFCNQMKRRGYTYVTRTVEEKQSFRVWRVE